MNSNNWMPLEARLEALAKAKPNEFPDHTANYWSRYTALVNYLRTAIYPHINAGLASLSKSPGIYTDHGKDHFDEVVRYAGLIVGDHELKPYDLYVLLCAIRLHDAGNIDGRIEHERRALAVLQGAGQAVCPDAFEARLIGDIAQAHGGMTHDNNKDTIGALQNNAGFGVIACEAKMIAALVRFSDEICEHSTRASSHHIQAGTLPAENTLFHLYAYGIKQALPDRATRSFRIKFSFDTDHLQKQYPLPSIPGTKPKTRYLLDDVIQRIQKLDNERRYCNRFLPEKFRTDQIEVEVFLTKTVKAGNQEIGTTWKHDTFVIQENGYPVDNTAWQKNASHLAGKAIAKALKGKK